MPQFLPVRPVLRNQGERWRQVDVPLVEEDQVREYLSKLGVYKPMGQEGMCAEVLGELASVIAGPLSNVE